MSASKRRSQDAGHVGARVLEKKARLEHQERGSDICENCFRIWRQFADDGRYARRWFGYIDKTKTELVDSGCRICILFADLISTHQIRGLPIKLRWDPVTNKYGTHGEIRLLGLDGSFRDTPPALLVSGSNVDGLKSSVRELHAEELKFPDIKNWVLECEELHGDSCKPISPDRLNGLRMIDCRQRTIVSAPPDCKFVALSYIWGPYNWGLNLLSGKPLEDVPATIDGSITATLALGYQYLWIDYYVCMPNPKQSMHHI
jgi:hypothetical protein